MLLSYGHTGSEQMDKQVSVLTWVTLNGGKNDNKWFWRNVVKTYTN